MGRKFNKKDKEIHNEAVKLRKMTDEQLTNYVKDLYVKGFDEGLIFKTKEAEKIKHNISKIKGIGPKTLEKINEVFEVWP